MQAKQSSAAVAGAGAGDQSVPTRIASALQDILATPRVTMNDDFFMLGGDSLAATSLAVFVEVAFGVLIDPVEVFERPHLAEFCEWLEAQLSTGPGSAEITG